MTPPIEWYASMLHRIEEAEDDPDDIVFISLTQKECLIYNLGLKLTENMFGLDIEAILEKMVDVISEQKGDDSIVKGDTDDQ